MTRMNLHDIVSQEAKRNPHVFYTQLRSAEPLSYVEGLNAWLTTTYEDTLFVLRDPRFIKDGRKVGAREQEEIGPIENMLMADPPDHERLRRLVSQAFTPRVIEHLRPRIQHLTDELLDAVQDRGTMDLILDFAYLLPITVISEMLGIPETDRARFRTWSQAILLGEADVSASSMMRRVSILRERTETKLVSISSLAHVAHEPASQ